MAVAYLAQKRPLERHFALYVSETQEQAEMHVAAIATRLEQIGVQRALSQYGHSRGWRRNQLRTANGFNVAAFGLDTGIRGFKLDEYRPDLILLDDIDALLDTLKTTEKKRDVITSSILPAGSTDCAVLFAQNQITSHSLMTQLWENSADFLYNHLPISREVAVEGLEYESVPDETGTRTWRITAGKPTWEGQDLKTCEAQLNLWGEKGFLREAQHEVESGQGVFFHAGRLLAVEPGEVPPLISVCLAGDLAATEGAGDYTALSLIGKSAEQRYYVLAVIRAQLSSERVRACIRTAASHYKPQYSNFWLRLPQDPGQAGKDQKGQFREAFHVYNLIIEPITGSKATRARGFAEQVNLGNVFLVEQDLPEVMRPYLETLRWQDWHRTLKWELSQFREDETDQVDDQVDGCSDGFNVVFADLGRIEYMENPWS